LSDLDQSAVGIWFYGPIDGSSIFQTNTAIKPDSSAMTGVAS